jgi:small subunit ribosomal protein S6
VAQLQSLAYAPDTLREYETIYILRPDTVSEKIVEINARVKGIIEDGDGKILKVDNWGRRRLAYEIKKELKGIYLYWQYLGSPEIVAEIERNMRMLDPVIRYMTVRTETDVDPQAVSTDLDDEAFERAAVTAADADLEDEGRDDDDGDDDDDDDDDRDEVRARRHDDDDDSSDSDSDSDDDEKEEE